MNDEALSRSPTCATTDTVRPRASVRPTSASVIQRGGRLLVVDDEPMICNVARRLLARRGYTVTVAHSASEALQLLEGTEFDLVITDWWMPGMCGNEFIARVQDRWPAVVVMVMSGCAENASGRSEDDGLFLSKPFSTEEITTRVARALGLRGA